MGNHCLLLDRLLLSLLDVFELLFIDDELSCLCLLELLADEDELLLLEDDEDELLEDELLLDDDRLFFF